VTAPAAEGFVTRHRFVLLLGTLVGFYVVAPIVEELRERLQPAAPPVVEGTLFLAVLLGAVASVARGRAWVLFALLLGLPVVALWLTGVVVESDGVAVVRHVFLAALLVYVMWVMLRVIFDSRQVTVNTVAASLCIYLLLGLVWALAYSVLDVLDPGAFTCTAAAARPPFRLQVESGNSTVVYFSFVTLTTLGYGDIVPTSPISRMLASTEAITGQLYLAVPVARLVGMHIAYSMGQAPAPAGEPGAEERMHDQHHQKPPGSAGAGLLPRP
jgi:hypothetical protein